MNVTVKAPLAVSPLGMQCGRAFFLLRRIRTKDRIADPLCDFAIVSVKRTTNMKGRLPTTLPLMQTISSSSHNCTIFRAVWGLERLGNYSKGHCTKIFLRF